MELIPLHLLEAFVEVCRQGTVSRAAQTLHRTQPAISYRINQLEEMTDVTLFERASPRWRLTARGELLLDEAESILARCRAVGDLLVEADREPRGRVNVGTLPTIARHYLAPRFSSLIADYDEVKWCLRIGLVDQLVAQLHNGDIDVLYLIGNIDVHGLDVVDVEPISMVYAISPELYDGDGPPTAAELAAHKLMLWKGDDATFAMVESHARANGLVTPTTPEIPDIDTLRMLARQGVGYTVLPDYVFRRDVDEGTLRSFPMRGFDMLLPMRQYVVSERYRSPALNVFINAVLDAA